MCILVCLDFQFFEDIFIGYFLVKMFWIKKKINGYRVRYGYTWIINLGRCQVWILMGIAIRVSMGNPTHTLPMAIPKLFLRQLGKRVGQIICLYFFFFWGFKGQFVNFLGEGRPRISIKGEMFKLVCT